MPLEAAASEGVDGQIGPLGCHEPACKQRVGLLAIGLGRRTRCHEGVDLVGAIAEAQLFELLGHEVRRSDEGIDLFVDAQPAMKSDGEGSGR